MSYFDILAARAGAGGGTPTPPPVLIEKSVMQNGTYSAEDDEADGYSAVAVNVPNSYAAGDEGKVVSNGALVAQGSDTVTQNGTVDTTLISSLTVNVPTGGQEIIGTFTRDPSLSTARWGVELSVKQNGKYVELSGFIRNNGSDSKMMSAGQIIGKISGLSLDGLSQSQTNWYNSASYTGITPDFGAIDEGTFQISIQSSITFAAKSSKDISILHELTTITL